MLIVPAPLRLPPIEIVSANVPNVNILAARVRVAVPPIFIAFAMAPKFKVPVLIVKLPWIVGVCPRVVTNPAAL
jgi:hypothetical protein